VEECLAAHESIQEAAALGVEDEKFGQRLKAFVVLNQGAKLSEDEVKAYVKDNLANYKVPREVVFVDELPRNQTGKVLKRELAEMGENGASNADGDNKAEGEDKAKGDNKADGDKKAKGGKAQAGREAQPAK
jgi:fatty-acyl-CoA synthase